jgi:hypothetical protein
MGIGPNRAVFRAGVHALVDMPIWGRRGDFFHLVLFPLSESPRKRNFWVGGTWSALHMIHLGLAPDPITPWLLYAAVCGRLPEKLTYIRALDPSSAAILEPWYNFSASDILGNEPQCQIRQLLVIYLDINDVSLL